MKQNLCLTYTATGNCALFLLYHAGRHILLTGIIFPFILFTACRALTSEYRNIKNRAQTLTTLKHKSENKSHVKVVLLAAFSVKIKP